MPPPKKKSKDRIKVNTRVQLKKDASSDGMVTAKSGGRGQWKVTWSKGPFTGQITDQSSMSLRPWQLDLASVAESSSGSEDESEDEGPEVQVAVDHEGNKRKFAKHAMSLVGKKVVVRPFLYFCISITTHEKLLAGQG